MNFPAIKRIPEILTRIGGTYTVPTLPWEINKATYNSNSLDASSNASIIEDIELSSDGTYLYVLGLVNEIPSHSPSSSPSSSPSDSPSSSVSNSPSNSPSVSPSHSPSNSPSEGTPSDSPSDSPSESPSASPSEGTPSSSPSEGTPSSTPSASPSAGTEIVSIYQYKVCDPWDLSTGQYDCTLDVSAQTTTPTSIKFFQSGTCLWVTDVAGIIYVYELSTAWNISTAVYNAAANSTVAAQTTDVQGICFANSEGLLFAIDETGDVYRYTATYNDPGTTLGSSSTVDLSSTISNPVGIQVHGDGSKLFIANTTDNKIYIFNLPSYYSLSSVTADGTYLDVSSQITTLAGFVIASDGFSLYAIDGNDSKIYEYSME